MTGKRREGMFKAVRRDGGDCRWFKVEMTRYPSTKWWMTELKYEGNGHFTLLKDTRQPLDGYWWGRLETWL